ncbi:MAG: hypothetical protein ACK41U_07580 [Paracoccus sp. (in: a-proteobacteria)]|uniref:hypothetical protein n=1 Tax=Paracoccus sp. TaxID=267 RepID=UPI003919B9C7
MDIREPASAVTLPYPTRTGPSGRAMSLVALMALSACGDRMTTDILPGGIPARTNLHEASGLPAASVRTVARREFGWRVIYLPAAAPPNAESRAAVALCGLERRAPLRVELQPRLDPFADPGARIFDIHCA